MSLISLDGATIPENFPIHLSITRLAVDRCNPDEEGNTIAEIYDILYPLLVDPPKGEDVTVFVIKFHDLVNPSLYSSTFIRCLTPLFSTFCNLRQLKIEGCDEIDCISSGILESPICLPSLVDFTCDVRLDARLLAFLAANPSIKTLNYLGYDVNGTASTPLSSDILPNLERLEVDIMLFSYLLTGRPVWCAIPIAYQNAILYVVHTELLSLSQSTANGGIHAGGGVKTFALGAPVPLQLLHWAMPNLEDLTLNENEMDTVVNDDGLPPSIMTKYEYFARAESYAQYFMHFPLLRKFSVNCKVDWTANEQFHLIERWDQFGRRLEKVVFDCRSARLGGVELVVEAFREIPPNETTVWVRNPAVSIWETHWDYFWDEDEDEDEDEEEEHDRLASLLSDDLFSP
ncbi:hypothetical protein M422DRAFT_39347 [Sphaerobolus stellatus SS14]|uniref:Uncharacterized protein n=1 Tax=Sphaerobolus stellatus (strain SS14) TaxID=990650 RepID=A0A0C9U4E9_SPHS4|nr:hypothetical protein M422DRAFT_39347 [Sphaerobolus stellatus SS14]